MKKQLEDSEINKEPQKKRGFEEGRGKNIRSNCKPKKTKRMGEGTDI
jgi:hypothetical protein